MTEPITDTSVPAVLPESAPVTVEVPAVNTESAPVEVPVAENTEVQGAEPSKAVKDLIDQRKKRQAAERDAAYWKGRHDALSADGKPAAQQVAPVVDVSPSLAAPKLDDFTSFEAYEQAKDEYLLAKAEQRVAQKFLQNKEAEQVKAVQTTYNERLLQAAKTDPGIVDIANDPTLPVSPAMAPILFESEHAPQLLRYFHDHREEATRIAMLSPMQAARAMGMLEAGIKSAVRQVVTPPRVSAAPAPISTVASPAGGLVDEDNLPLSQWIARRNKVEFGR